MTTLEFMADPEAFLAAAGAHLAADPLLGTVVATVTAAIAAETASVAADSAQGSSSDLPFTRWWVVARHDRGRDADSPIAGVGMRTAPFAPYPLYVMPMPDEAAVQLARSLVERGEVIVGSVCGVNGSLPTVRVCADEIARLIGGTVREQVHTRLFEYRPVQLAAGGVEVGESEVGESEVGGSEVGDGDGGRVVRGARRLAGADDVPLVTEWLASFGASADEQAGRRPGEGVAHDAELTEEQVLRRIEHHRVWLWEDPVGTPVHLTQASPPSFGVVRIGPVYTPGEHRGQGYATAMVDVLSRELDETGARVCLFTDQANPTSNAIYQRIGYVPVVDMVNLLVEPR